jgi:AcrR family transcriptional regulator
MTDAPPALPARTRKPRGQGHERRGEILAAAKALFIAEGYEGFTTRKLAAQVGVSQTGIYVYFRGKDEIFDALCRQSFEQLAEAFRDTQDVATEGFERLRALGRAYIDFGLAHPDEYRLTFMEGPGLLKGEMRDVDLGRPMDQQGIGNQVFLIIRQTLKSLDEAGLLRPLDLTIATHTVWFGLHGLVSILIARPAFPKLAPDELVGPMIESIIAGLARTPDAG